MRKSRTVRRCTSIAAAVAVTWTGGVHPAEDAGAPVDAEFLEFLGSDDSDDIGWSALLAASAKAAGNAKEKDDRKAEPAEKKVQPADESKGEPDA